MPEDTTLFDRLLNKIKNNKSFVIILIIGVVIISIGNFTDAITKVQDFIYKSTGTSPTKGKISNQTGVKDARQSEGVTIDIENKRIINNKSSQRMDKLNKKSVEYLEGMPSDLHVFDYSGHKLYKHWNGISFTDPYFKTKEGVGVGAMISDFDKQYGKGVVSWSEDGHVVSYEHKGVLFYAQIPHYCISNNDTEFFINDRTCEVEEVWIPITPSS